MTDLLDAYERHREQGQSHNGALNALARRFDLDKPTVERVIERAQRAETKGGSVKKFSRPLRHPRSPGDPLRTQANGSRVRGAG